MGERAIVIRFPSRCDDGEDVAPIIRENLPGADVRVELDERGAVERYRLTVWFPEDRVADAAFRLRDLLDELGLEATFS